MLGAYGPWAATIAPDPPELSFRREEWKDVHAWRAAGRERVLLRLARPETAGVPAVLALHDHSADKYFGREKITRTGDDQHPLMAAHLARMYAGRAWANEL